MTRPIVADAVYLDTSDCVKLDMDEAQSDAVAEQISAATTHYSVLIAWAEMH